MDIWIRIWSCNREEERYTYQGCTSSSLRSNNNNNGSDSINGDRSFREIWRRIRNMVFSNYDFGHKKFVNVGSNNWKNWNLSLR